MQHKTRAPQGQDKRQETTLKYKGFFKHVNDKPTGEHIELFVSDWNKDHWAFYVYISLDDYETDIEDILELMRALNWRDGDVYCELINRTPELEHFYHYLYELGDYTQNDVLNPRYWEIYQEKGDNHFLYFSKLNGSSSIDDLESSEYYVYNDWYEVLETYNPDLYKCLDESNGLGCFDIGLFFNCQGFDEIDGNIIAEG